jgi:general secretion pathway protein G
VVTNSLPRRNRRATRSPTDPRRVSAVDRNIGQAGFTLIELLVVLVIIGLLATLVAPNFIGQSERAKPKVARTQMENLRNALDMFQLDVGRYPTTQEGLEALRSRPNSAARWSGPYLRDELPLDPWGSAYQYRSEGSAYEIMSFGGDGRSGGDGTDADVIVGG